MADMNLVYKMIVLRMLKMIDAPLSNIQITNFFLDYQYTDYFNAQIAINELVDSKLLNVNEYHGNTQYIINDEGMKTLELFSDKVNLEVEKDLKEFLKKNKIDIKEENSVQSFYSEISSGGYRVTCQLKSNDKVIYEVNSVVHSKEQAEAICNNWNVKYEELYFEFLDKLIM